jgi:N-acetylglucosaminyl-diphospho-decaprenol L-rhamnosyltransferase
MIDVVIVNWKSEELIRACLNTLSMSEDRHLISSISIVDNSGELQSAPSLRMADAPLRLISPGKNLGFGAACNLATKDSFSPYILFLNPDVLWLEGHAPLQCMMTRFSDTGMGVVGAKLLGANNQITRTCARFPSFLNIMCDIVGISKIFPHIFKSMHMHEWNHACSAYVDHVIGAFYLIERKLFESLKGFDERFFVYMEDLDLSKRVRDFSCAVYFDAEAIAFHEGGGTTNKIPATRLSYSLAGRTLYIFKHFSIASAYFLTALTVCIEPFSRLLRATITGSFHQVQPTIKGFFYYIRWISRGGILNRMIKP